MKNHCIFSIHNHFTSVTIPTTSQIITYNNSNNSNNSSSSNNNNKHRFQMIVAAEYRQGNNISLDRAEQSSHLRE
ncbi:hypothetical protein DPMN_097105 [Dreissena polymorpha]|uniref:Uncharacterized protein n=1 Tax=Dreissena polymorpha TaxID=45954 RepID=A0A9D4LCC8_DREPO|nr:hypothetical protein DPMN_097105 [Dreissena polymorpha]